jgi:phage terminase small subunit
MQRLTDKQRRFCLEYLANGHNATQAAVAAGYSKKAAHIAGCRQLKRAGVMAFLAERGAAAAAEVQKVEAELELSARRVLTETMRIAYVDPRRAFNLDGSLKRPDEWSDDLAASVASVEVFEEFEGQGKDRMQVGWTKKVRFWDKPRGLEMLGKHLKLWTDVVDHRIDGMDLQAKAERAAELIAGALARKGAAA